ncbi:hypothetical protein [Brochothrix phage ADU4]|nr:hypothetical protein [Brochothrix phage ADU4]
MLPLIVGIVSFITGRRNHNPTWALSIAGLLTSVFISWALLIVVFGFFLTPNKPGEVTTWRGDNGAKITRIQQFNPVMQVLTDFGAVSSKIYQTKTDNLGGVGNE